MGFPDKKHFDADPMGATRLWRDRSCCEMAIRLIGPALRHLKAGDGPRAEASLIRARNRIMRHLQVEEDMGAALGLLLEAERITEPSLKRRRSARA